jgi:hypothetical protein
VQEIQGQSKSTDTTITYPTIVVIVFENVKNYRRQGQPIIYTDQTYIHAYLSYRATQSSLLAPVLKGQQAIIIMRRDPVHINSKSS